MKINTGAIATTDYNRFPPHFGVGHQQQSQSRKGTESKMHYIPEYFVMSSQSLQSICIRHLGKIKKTSWPNYSLNSTWLVTSRLDTTRHVRRVQPMHFSCVELVEHHGLTRSSRRARHVERVVSRRDVTWRVKWNLGLSQLVCSHSAVVQVFFVNSSTADSASS